MQADLEWYEDICLEGSTVSNVITCFQLVEPINQSSELDSIVPALCAFLLGICYEFDREPGEITRSASQLYIVEFD